MCAASSGGATTYPRNATYSTSPERSRETIASRTGVGETSRSLASPSMLSREPGAQRDSSRRWRISSSTSARRTCRRTAIAAPPSPSRPGLRGRAGPLDNTASPYRKSCAAVSGGGLVPGSSRVRRASHPSPRQRVREPQVLGDDAELHLGGALPHLQHAGVAVVAGHHVLVEEAVAAPDLAGVAGVGRRGLAAHQLGHRRLLAEGHPGIEAPGGLVHERTRGGHPRLHAGEGEGDVLPLAEGPAEHDPPLRVVHGLLEAALGGADAEGRERHPALVEDGEEVREAAAALPQQVLLGHAHV